jgi:hypothetical protein
MSILNNSVPSVHLLLQTSLSFWITILPVGSTVQGVASRRKILNNQLSQSQMEQSLYSHVHNTKQTSSLASNPVCKHSNNSRHHSTQMTTAFPQSTGSELPHVTDREWMKEKIFF